MPYTPPAYNAVTFNFVSAPAYVPPAYNVVIFNFGATTPPPPPSQALPRGIFVLLREQEDEPWAARRRFSPPSGAPVVVPSFRRPGMWVQEEEMELRGVFLTRKFVVVVDDDDVMITLLV